MVLIKSFWNQSLSFVNCRTERERIQAIVLLAFTIETCLRSAVEQLGGLKKSNRANLNLYELHKRVIEALNGAGKDISKIPPWKQVGFVQEHRNAAQHDAVAPDVSVIERARVYASDFLDEIFPLAFDTQFSEVSLAFLVDDEYSKKLIMRAEEELSNGHSIESACFARAALLLAKERITPRERRWWSWTFPGEVAETIGVISGDFGLQSDVKNFLEWVEQSIDDLKLGFIDEGLSLLRRNSPQVCLQHNRGEDGTFRWRQKA